MDKIPNFWISYFSKGHENLTSLLVEIVEYPDTLPLKLSHIIHSKLRTLKIPKTTDLSLI